MVRRDLADDVTVGGDAGLMWGRWVKDCRLRYSVVIGVLTAGELKDRMAKLKVGGGGRVRPNRNPVVVSRVVKTEEERVSVKVDVLSGEVVVTLVRDGTVLLWLRKEDELPVLEGGVCMNRLLSCCGLSVTGSFGYSNQGHV